MPRRVAAVAAGAIVALLAACSSGSSVSTATSAPAAAPSTTPPSTAPRSTAASTSEAAPPSMTSVTATTAGPSPTSPAAAPATVAELLAHRIVLAHAGGDDDYPHSTPFAFAESAKAGVDMLDLDVRLSADGVLVVQHDDDVDRTTDATGPVATRTYAELRALDNAYWFNTVCNTCKSQPEAAYTWRGVRTGAKPPPAGYTADDFIIPTFRDIATRFPSLPLNIEIKGTIDDGIGVPVATALVAELKALGREASTVVTSFDDQVLAAFHQLAPDVALSPGLQVSAAWVLSNTPLPDGMKILQLPPEYQGLTVLTPDTIARATAAGYAIWVWPNGGHFETAAGYQELFAMGIAGVNASKPAAAVAARPPAS
jgi:glycerophosphoryl diester phosphodiesterase